MLCSDLFEGLAVVWTRITPLSALYRHSTLSCVSVIHKRPVPLHVHCSETKVFANQRPINLYMGIAVSLVTCICEAKFTK